MSDFTFEDRAALKAAIATGALKVKFGSGPDSREVEYRSLSEMRSILAQMNAELTPPSSPVLPTSFISHSRD